MTNLPDLKWHGPHRREAHGMQTTTMKLHNIGAITGSQLISMKGKWGADENGCKQL